MKNGTRTELLPLSQQLSGAPAAPDHLPRSSPSKVLLGLGFHPPYGILMRGGGLYGPSPLKTVHNLNSLILWYLHRRGRKISQQDGAISSCLLHARAAATRQQQQRQRKLHVMALEPAKICCPTESIARVGVKLCRKE